ALIGLVVFIHELGHYIAARMTGTPVETFGIGFGPALVERSLWGTKWRIGCIPLGGYVKMELPEDATRVFKNTAIVLAGPAMNFLLAFICLIGACLLQDMSISEAVARAWQGLGLATDATLHAFGKLLSLSSAEDFQGPVGMVSSIKGIIVDQGIGFAKFLVLVGVISFGLGFMNLIPVPPLDGGKFVFLWLRLLAPRFMKTAELVVRATGALALFAFLIFVTFKDVIKLF
ncbi:MAG: site-2 protease family protein, partial [Planctomycetota bacterium]